MTVGDVCIRHASKQQHIVFTLGCGTLLRLIRLWDRSFLCASACMPHGQSGLRKFSALV
jgi:hypothetical protein